MMLRIECEDGWKTAGWQLLSIKLGGVPIAVGIAELIFEEDFDLFLLVRQSWLEDELFVASGESAYMPSFVERIGEMIKTSSLALWGAVTEVVWVDGDKERTWKLR